MKRIFLFLLTNMAILMVLSVTLRLLGVERILDDQGVNLNYESLLIFAGVLGFGGALLSLALSKWAAKRATGARVITTASNQTEQWLLHTVSQQARQVGIRTPEVAIYDAADINAFATGARRNAGLVAVSSGLLQKMSKDEAEAVLAHEISHISNGDMVTLALIQGVVNTFVIFLSRIIGHAVDRIIFKTQRGHGIAFWITTIIAELVLGILASIIVFWFSRKREFAADAGAAKLVGSRKMIAALVRLQSTVGQPHLSDKMAVFGISGAKNITRLFATHPPLEARIAALKNTRVF